MKPRIGHIIFHPKLVEISAAVSREMAAEIAGIEIAQPDPLDDKDIIRVARELEKKCDVLISRVDTINLLAPILSIPVVERYLTFADIMEALYQASKKGGKAALVVHSAQDCDLEPWPVVFGLEVIKELYHSREEALPAVLRAKEKGVTVIVGGVLTEKHAVSCGLQHQMIEIHKDTVTQCVRKAIDIYRAIQKERDYLTRFQALLDFAHEGVIFLEGDQTVVYVNDRACQLLEVARSDLLKKPLGKSLKDCLLPEGKETLEKILGEKYQHPQAGILVKFKDKSIVANIVPSSLVENMTTTIITFTEASQLQKVEYNVRRQLASKGLVARFNLKDIVGASAGLECAKKEARAFAATDATVLIYGETGTGKELFAQSIHNLSARRKGPFVAINCSALPKELMESELFGYEEGAFTGARKTGKAGLFELAHGGTIFLDEIGTMPLDLQAKILRVIQEREVARLGGDKVIPVNVRIIAATNCNLEEAVRKGEFRQDLYYRLNVLLLRLPPLRERMEDIPLLFKHFVKKFATQLNADLQLPGQEDLEILQRYHWPGNVRELENFAERFVAIATYNRDPAGVLEHLLQEIKPATKQDCPAQVRTGPARTAPLAEALANNEVELIRAVGEEVNWNKKKMAEILGISPTTLWRKLKKAGLNSLKLTPVKE
ncbi:Anaerobic nitric oxide reductase transcription regulator NorR [Neomoorella glycerini]|uniref:Anaerobic nitric oxide reductase transcription regulator NorR n=1 Tax=Neomoorella glycerini TaxID=55779 RepID=A0A6I5ZTS6_9FIRM|nr:sigma 54-interacting transcriptional regulator [Moorella glycerini]QGP93156.1 Anaerobic nitric oxide reductase transcription regulator NorR [Moorella glycerini]